MAGPNAEQATPNDGSDVRQAANQIAGLLREDDGGHLNVSDGRMSRAHPDYDHTQDHDQQPVRDTKSGRFTKKAAPPAWADC